MFSFTGWVKHRESGLDLFKTQCSERSLGLVWMVYKENEDMLSFARTGTGRVKARNSEDKQQWDVRADEEPAVVSDAVRKPKPFESVPDWSGICSVLRHLDFHTYSLFNREAGWVLCFLGLISLPLRWHRWIKSLSAWPTVLHPVLNNNQNTELQCGCYKAAACAAFKNARYIVSLSPPQRKRYHSQDESPDFTRFAGR